MADIYTRGVVTRPVAELLPGDRVDLEGDAIADPEGHAGGESPACYQFEFQTVESIERETPDCLCVYFENGPAVGFPANHRVEVDGEQTPGERIANAIERLDGEPGIRAETARAVSARIQGEWDHPGLVAFGPLSIDTAADVAAILNGKESDNA